MGKRVLLALSGGADSAALFCLLARLHDEGKMILSCAHFEHGIRGEESIADRDFVRMLAKERNIPLIEGSANIPEEALKAGEGIETCARRMRHAFLREAKKQAGADVIALAHHLNDQAETVLMHMFRGGGLAGAGGMRMIDNEIVRPLLNTPKSELIAYLEELGQPWREDATNRISDTPRNILRNEVMPKVLTAYPGAEKAVARFASIARDEDDFLNAIALDTLNKRVCAYAGVYKIPDADEIPTAVFRRIFRMLVPGADYEDVERAREAKAADNIKGKNVIFKQGSDLYIALRIQTPEGVLLPEAGECILPGICTADISPCDPVPVMNNGFTQVLNADALKGACLRTRRDGDYMIPLGMNGRKKLLSDILTDKKIPRPIKNRMPVIAVESEILWAAGVGISDKAKVYEGVSAKRIQIRINDKIGGDTK